MKLLFFSYDLSFCEHAGDDKPWGSLQSQNDYVISLDIIQNSIKFSPNNTVIPMNMIPCIYVNVFTPEFWEVQRIDACL